MQGTIEIVREAQNGDEGAIRKLFNIVREHHMPRYVGRYRGSNVLVDNDEIESEFLLGFWKALPKAKLDVGNPINFLCWKGQKAVQTLMRKTLCQEVRYECLGCGAVKMLNTSRRKGLVCAECGCANLWTWMVVGAADDDATKSYRSVGATDADTVWQLATYGIQIEELRSRLSGRVRDLFDKIVLEGIQRGTCKNYIAEIAECWGCSTAFVAATLRKLRAEVLDYIGAA